MPHNLYYILRRAEGLPGKITPWGREGFFWYKAGSETLPQQKISLDFPQLGGPLSFIPVLHTFLQHGVPPPIGEITTWLLLFLVCVPIM